MAKDVISPILAKIYTKNENILGMLKILEGIMDKKSYQDLYQRYEKIANLIPKEEILTEAERKYINFGTELRYTTLEGELNTFEQELTFYNVFKELSDIRNEVDASLRELFKDDSSLALYVNSGKILVQKILEVKEEKTLHQFTNLMSSSFGTLFDALKNLSAINNDTLLRYINNLESDYLKENLGALIRNSVDTYKYKGSIDEDFLTEEVLRECALGDKKIRETLESIKAVAKAQERIKEELKAIQEEINDLNNVVDNDQKQLKQIKQKRKVLELRKRLRQVLFGSFAVVPLAAPFVGYKIGKNASAKINLIKTITKTVDARTLEEVVKEEKYEELTTDYVYSVTICEPWHKNISGVSYVRNCTVYDYVLSEEERKDDFHLTLDNLNYDQLVKKYSYEEPTEMVDDSYYLEESQLYITETFQDAKDFISSDKYNVFYTTAGVGVLVCLYTTEALLYYLGGENLLYAWNEKYLEQVKEYEREDSSTSNSLKLTLKKKEELVKEYDEKKKKLEG